MKYPPIAHILDTSFNEWEDYICTLVFLPGCNLRCTYCHNMHIVKSAIDLGIEALAKVLDKNKGWIEGVVITGGEPTIYCDNLLNLITWLKDRKLKIKIHTNGMNSDIIKQACDDVDTVAMDIKLPFDNESKFGLDMYEVLQSFFVVNDFCSGEFHTTVCSNVLSIEELVRIDKWLCDKNSIHPWYIQKCGCGCDGYNRKSISISYHNAIFGGHWDGC